MSKIANYHFRRLPSNIRLMCGNVEGAHGHGYFKSIIHDPFWIKIVVLDNDPRTRFKVTPNKDWYSRITAKCAKIMDVPSVAIVDDRNQCIESYSMERLYSLRKTKRYRVVVVSKKKEKKCKKTPMVDLSSQVVVIPQKVEEIPEEFVEMLDGYNCAVIKRIYQEQAYDRPSIMRIAHDVAKESFVSCIWNHGVRAINNTINTIANHIYRTVNLVQRIHSAATDYWTREALIAKTRAEIRRTTLASWIYNKCATPIFHHECQYRAPVVECPETYSELSRDIKASAIQICGLFDLFKKSRICKLRIIKAAKIPPDLATIPMLSFADDLRRVADTGKDGAGFGDLVYLEFKPMGRREGLNPAKILSGKTLATVANTLSSTGSVKNTLSYSPQVVVILAKKTSSDPNWTTVQMFNVERTNATTLGPSFVVPLEDATYKFIVLVTHTGNLADLTLEGEWVVKNATTTSPNKFKLYSRIAILNGLKAYKLKHKDRPTSALEVYDYTSDFPPFVEKPTSLGCMVGQVMDATNITALVSQLYNLPILKGVSMEDLLKFRVAPKSKHILIAVEWAVNSRSEKRPSDDDRNEAWKLMQMDTCGMFGQVSINANYMGTGEAYMHQAHARNKEKLLKSEWGHVRPGSMMAVGADKSSEVVSVTLAELAAKNDDPVTADFFSVWAAVCSTLDQKYLPSMIVDSSMERNTFDNRSIVLSSDTTFSLTGSQELVVAIVLFWMMNRFKSEVVTTQLLDRTFTSAKIAARANVANRLLNLSISDATISNVASFGLPIVSKEFVDSIKK